MPDFGEQFARIRGARGVSQETLARISGISRTTIARAEAAQNCPINASTMLLILKALSSASPPLDAQEATWLAAQAGVDRTVALAYLPEPQAMADRDAVAALVSELHTLVGAQLLRDLLNTMARAIRASRQPATSPPRARGLVAKHPPVQRPGYIEETEVEYRTGGDDSGEGTSRSSKAGF